MNLPSKYSDRGKSIFLMLRLTKNIFGKRKIVVLDYYFCALQVLMSIKKKGVYGAPIINKRLYLSWYVYGENTKDQLTGRYVGDVDSICGKLENVPIHVFAMKEEDCAMIFMSIYETNDNVDK